MARLVGLDIGSTYTRIWTQEGGIVLRCPSAAAIDGQTRKLVALGEEARKMIGKTPQDILASCPIKEGLVSEFLRDTVTLPFFADRGGIGARTSRLRHPDCGRCAP